MQRNNQITPSSLGRYGHIRRMADAIKEGVEATGATAELYRVAETLPEEALGKMGAPPKDESIPVADPHTLPEADGILFGTPTRFGVMSSQMKALMDATGSLWMSGGLVGKPAGVFFSTGTPGGGQETTALTFLTQLTHHGMVYVPLGYGGAAGADLMNLEEVHGGSPYGAGTLAGADGTRMPSALELRLATHQGNAFAKFVSELKAGKSAVAAATTTTTAAAAAEGGGSG